MNDNIMIYIHIPFCVKKCNYCDFLSFAVGDSEKGTYVDALCRQIEYEAGQMRRSGFNPNVTSIYIGGGTPSVLAGDRIAQIMSKVYECYSVSDISENTIEVNPGTVDLCKLKSMRQAGINRISIGLQSADDEELKMLGRIHSYDDFLSCYDMARNVGIKNINVDIMTALPNQTEDKLMSTLSKVTAMEPEHISAYSLIIEEGTAFYEKYGGLETPVVGEDTERQLYWMCTDYLEECGYGHYEISNYARRGYNSRHNSGYWKRIPYTAFGLGASSLVNCVIDGKPVQMRTVNEDRLKEYLLDPTQKSERQVLSKDDAMDEYMFLGLRMREGVRYVDFYKEFNEDMLIRYKNSIESYTDKGLLRTDNDGIRLTRRGIDYGNYVFSGFLVNN